MAKVLSSISGNLISAASAGYAPTNSADVSTIASAYQVVSSTATQLYAGTTYLTSVNDAPVSASRAGNAANASMATSAYYDGTGRLISALPDSAAVSSIASSYAESAVSSKADSSSLSSYALSSDVSGVIDTVSANSASWSGGTLPITGSAGNDSATYGAGYVEYTRYDTAGEPDIRTASLSPDQFYIDYTLDENDHTIMTLTESMLDFTDSEGDHVVDAYSIDSWNSAVNTVANNSASWGGGATGDYVEKSATEVAIGSANTARNTAFAQGTANRASSYSFAQGYINSASSISFAQGIGNTASGVSFAQGGGNSAINTAAVFGQYNLSGDGDTTSGNSAAFAIGDGTAYNARHDLMLVTKDGEITMYSSTADTVGTGIMSSIRAISAAATGASVSLPITGSAGGDTASYGANSLEFTRYDTAGEPDIRTASLSPDSLWIDYTLDENDHTIMTLTESMLDFTDSEGDHVVDAYSIDNWNSAVDTVANNSASWGQGGVDSATVSAIASSYAESAVSSKADSSALSSYAKSADVSAAVNKVTSMSGNWNTTYDTVFYNSAYWTSGYTTVRDNSASWGQGGVDSATVSAIASAYQVVSSLGYKPYEDDEENFLTAVVAINGNMISAASALWAREARTANRAGTAEVAFWDEDGRDISSLPGSAEVSAIASSYAESAVSSKQDSSAMTAYALSSDVSGVIDTVSTNSASWGAGATLPIIGSAGTDSATYGETSVEFYRYDTAGEPDIRTATLSPDALDITYTVDENDYYSVHINENGVEFSDPDGYYTVTPYDITNWNSAVETVANNSAAWGQGGVDSATVSSIASSYAESAASSKQDSSAMTSYALSSDVSGTVDLVSTQSANWGGSALALSAGPGVKLEMSGNTLVAGLDETVLWSGSATTANFPISLSETLANFESVKFYWRAFNYPAYNYVVSQKMISGANDYYTIEGEIYNTSTQAFYHVAHCIRQSSLNLTYIKGAFINWVQSSTSDAAGFIAMYKIVGINRTAGV